MSSSLVVSNASTLIALDQVDHLDLLQHLFPVLVIPPAVAEEIAPTVVLPSWIKTRSLTQPIGPLILATSLGPGESAALSLGMEVDAGRVILDERAARRCAQSLEMPVIGTLGILAAARRRELIPAIRPLLDELLKHDFRVATALFERVLRDAGEL